MGCWYVERLLINSRHILVGSILTVFSLQALAVDDTKFRDLNESLLDNIVIPAYRDLLQSATTLNHQAVNSCALPDEANFSHLQLGFKIYVDSWKAIELFRSGPVEYQFRQSRIQYWPDKHGVVGRQLKQLLVVQDDASLDQASFIQLSAGVQGITALEVLLYEKNAEALFVDTTRASQFRCQLIQAISRNQKVMLRGLLDDWQRKDGGYRRLLVVDPGLQEPRDIGIDILRLLYGEILVIKELKLGRPLDKSIGKARPRRSELWRSELSQSNIRRNLQTVAQFFNPDSPWRNYYELEDANENQSIAQKIYRLLEQSSEILSELSLPIDQAVSDATEREILVSLVEHLARIAQQIERYTSVVYESPLGFNSFDGD